MNEYYGTCKKNDEKKINELNKLLDKLNKDNDKLNQYANDNSISYCGLLRILLYDIV